jgi:hypothetical protein
MRIREQRRLNTTVLTLKGTIVGGHCVIVVKDFGVGEGGGRHKKSEWVSLTIASLAARHPSLLKGMLEPIRSHIPKLSPLIYEDCMGEPAQTLTLDLLCTVSLVFPVGMK